MSRVRRLRMRVSGPGGPAGRRGLTRALGPYWEGQAPAASCDVCSSAPLQTTDPQETGTRPQAGKTVLTRVRQMVPDPMEGLKILLRVLLRNACQSEASSPPSSPSPTVGGG